MGFSDLQIASLRNVLESQIKQTRIGFNLHPVYKTVDTCAGEFAALTPYYYSAYDEESEVLPRTKEAVIILGSGPNRIGQGIEFDYSCVHASFALRKAGYETIMVNCNPETVSTDYDTSDRLYFEPLTLEDVLEIIAAESAAGPVKGVIAQLGGQTPLGLARGLMEAGVKILGTSPDAIDLAEDNIYNFINRDQVDFIRFVLNNYIQEGIDELDISNLSTIINAKYGSINEAQRNLGSSSEIKKVLISHKLWLKIHLEIPQNRKNQKKLLQRNLLNSLH